MNDKVYLDISIIRCPNCGKLYADASWYVLDMESDIECGVCGYTFNSTKNLVKRLLLEIDVKNNFEVKTEEINED